MNHVARTPPLASIFGIPVALALLAGVTACLWLPWLAPWWLSLVMLVAGLSGWSNRPQVWLPWPIAERFLEAGRSRLAGAFLCGCGLTGLHAADALSVQLPVSLEKQETIVHGRVIDLPQHEPRRTRFLFEVDAEGAALSE